MKRFFLIVLGLIVLLLGLGAGAAGGAAVAVIGSDGRYDTAVGSAHGEGYALVFNQFEIHASGQETIRSVAEVTVGAHTLSGNELFVGLAPTKTVSEYLSGVPHEVVTDVSDAKTVSIPGNTAPTPPGEKAFWSERAVGLDPIMALPPDSSKLSLVIMNADGTTNVDAEVRVGISSGSAFPVGIGMIVLGVILIILAIWIFVRAGKARKRPPLPPAASPSTGAGLGYLPPASYPGQPPVVPPSGQPVNAPPPGPGPLGPTPSYPAQPPGPPPSAPR